MSPPKQLTRGNLKSLTDAELVAAHRAGRLEALKAGRQPEPDEAPEGSTHGDIDQGARGGPPTPRQLTKPELALMAPEQIVRANRAGQLDEILGRRP